MRNAWYCIDVDGFVSASFPFFSRYVRNVLLIRPLQCSPRDPAAAEQQELNWLPREMSQFRPKFCHPNFLPDRSHSTTTSIPPVILLAVQDTTIIPSLVLRRYGQCRRRMLIMYRCPWGYRPSHWECERTVGSVSFALVGMILIRSTGKQWHAPKKAFRPGSGLTPYEQRAKARAAQAVAKAKEKELKEEKEAERQVRIHTYPRRHRAEG